LAGGKNSHDGCSSTDGFDNPVIKNTPVLIKKSILNNITIDTEKNQRFHCLENIFSSRPSGKILVSTECKKHYKRDRS
jgi:hypothetical protein